MSVMIKALDESGFDKNNADHALIVCRDAFDRGSQLVRMKGQSKSSAFSFSLFY